MQTYVEYRSIGVQEFRSLDNSSECWTFLENNNDKSLPVPDLGRFAREELQQLLNVCNV